MIPCEAGVLPTLGTLLTHNDTPLMSGSHIRETASSALTLSRRPARESVPKREPCVPTQHRARVRPWSHVISPAQLILLSVSVGRIDMVGGTNIECRGYCYYSAAVTRARFKGYMSLLVYATSREDWLLARDMCVRARSLPEAQVLVVATTQPSDDFVRLTHCQDLCVGALPQWYKVSLAGAPPVCALHVAGELPKRTTQVSSLRLMRALRKHVSEGTRDRKTVDQLELNLQAFVMRTPPLGSPAKAWTTKELMAADPYRGSRLPPGSTRVKSLMKVEGIRRGHLTHCLLCNPDMLPSDGVEVDERCYTVMELLRRDYGVWCDPVDMAPPPMRTLRRPHPPWHESVYADMEAAKRGINKYYVDPHYTREAPAPTKETPDRYAPLKVVITGAARFKVQVARTGAAESRVAATIAVTLGLLSRAFGSDIPGVVAGIVKSAIKWPADPKARVVMRCDVNFNDFYASAPFQYVDVFDAAATLVKADWISLRDFRAFYLGIPIHPQHYPDTTYYCPVKLKWMILRGMAFGMKLAPYYCSAVSIEAVMCLRGEVRRLNKKTRAKQRAHCARSAHARRAGKHVQPLVLSPLERWALVNALTVYVDDTFNKANDEAALKAGDELITCIVRDSLGIPFAEGEKALDAIPTQEKVFLGVLIDTLAHPLYVTLGISAQRCRQLVASLRVIVREARLEKADSLLYHSMPTQRLDSLLGQLGFALPFLRGMPNFLATSWELKHLRYISIVYGFRAPSQFWRDFTRELIGDLEVIRDTLAENIHGMSVVLDTTRHVTYLRIKSDASGSDHKGWGWYATNDDGTQYHGTGKWTAKQFPWSILTKELFPIVAAIAAHGAEWSGRVIMSGVDNAGLASCVNAQRGRDKYTRGQMRVLARLLSQYDIILLGFWTPRIWNVVADLMSKGCSFDVAIVRARHVYAAQIHEATPTSSSGD